VNRAPARRRPDLRWRGLLLTLALIAVVGLLVQGLPGGSPPAADDAFDVTRHMQAQRVATRFREAVNLQHTGQPAKALTVWEDVIALAPSLPEAWVNRGFVLLDLDRPGEAEAAFRRAIVLRPGQANAHYGLAQALAAQARLEAARAAMRRFLRHTAPGDPWLARAHALLRQWQPENGEAPGDDRAGTMAGRASGLLQAQKLDRAQEPSPLVMTK